LHQIRRIEQIEDLADQRGPTATVYMTRTSTVLKTSLNE
jgi:hypothetical protein